MICRGSACVVGQLQNPHPQPPLALPDNPFLYSKLKRIGALPSGLGLSMTLLTRVVKTRSMGGASRAQRPDPSSPPSRAAPDVELGNRRARSGVTAALPCSVATACAEDRRDGPLLLAWSLTILWFPDDVQFNKGCSSPPIRTYTLARAT